jgi:Uma2 family endonuclease
METVRIDRTKEWTVADYLLLGELDSPCQLINGELIMSPAPTPLHQRVSKRIFKLLDKASYRQGEVFYSPFDLYVDSKNVLQPDLVFIAEKNKQIISERGIDGTPDLIVEIISPSNIFTDRNIKKKTYQKIGVKEYWIVDPGNQTLEIYTHDQSDPETPSLYLAAEGEVTSSVISALAFDLKIIFE